MLTFSPSHPHTLTQSTGNLRDVIFTTLLELYLAEIGACPTPEDRQGKEKKALELMHRKNATFDLDHALGNPRQPLINKKS